MKTEDRLQQECYTWFHNEYPDLRLVMWHTENEGKRNGRAQMRFKTMGGTPGVADLIWFYGGEFFAFELKTQTGTQSKSQKEWQAAIEKQGGHYRIVRTIGEFQYYVQSVLGKL